MKVSYHRRLGKTGLILLLVVGAILLFAFLNTPEGKSTIQKALSSQQPTVYVSLTPYLIENGYYVNIKNYGTKDLMAVYIEYAGSQGNSRLQHVGYLAAGETKTLDPSQYGWRVAKSETICVYAEKHIKKVIETNSLIDK